MPSITVPQVDPNQFWAAAVAFNAGRAMAPADAEGKPLDLVWPDGMVQTVAGSAYHWGLMAAMKVLGKLGLRDISAHLRRLEALENILVEHADEFDRPGLRDERSTLLLGGVVHAAALASVIQHGPRDILSFDYPELMMVARDYASARPGALLQ